MALLGRANWYLPRWLDRVLPQLDVEGHAPEVRTPVAAAAEEPVPVSSGAGSGSR